MPMGHGSYFAMYSRSAESCGVGSSSDSVHSGVCGLWRVFCMTVSLSFILVLEDEEWWC